MKLKKIKTEAEILEAMASNIAGRPRVEINTVDGSIKSVRVGCAHFGMDSYTFTINAETDREEATRYRVKATVPGFPVATSYHELLADANDAEGAFPNIADVSVESVRVWIGADGEVIAEKGDKATAVDTFSDDIPF